MQRALIYEFGSRSQLESIDGWNSVSSSREDDTLCKMRERWMELEFLKRLDLQFFYAAKDNVEADIFTIYTPDWKPVESLSDTEVLLRASVGKEFVLIDTVESLGGFPLVDRRQEMKIRSWIGNVQRSFSKRSIGVYNRARVFPEVGEIDLELVEEYMCDGAAFVKTVEKGHSGMIYRNGNEHGRVLAGEYGPAFDIPIHTAPCDPVLISEPIHFMTDDKAFAPNLEYRCWIVNDVPVSFSRYLDYDTEYEVPEEVIHFADMFIREHHNYAFAYVLDIGLDKNKGPLVVELNSIQAAGRYGNNSFPSFISQFYGDIYQEYLDTVAAGIAKEDDQKLDNLSAPERSDRRITDILAMLEKKK